VIIRILTIGKTSTPYLKQGVDVYLGRLKHYVKLEYLELADVSVKERTKQKEKEGELILKNIKADDFLILLDENGKNPTSRELADFFQKKMNAGTRCIVLVIGGAFGFSEEIYARADYQLSFSRMTFSHEMIRLFLLEQVYRSFTIIKGESYHHD
jgi:23S rRNA (pseudouridine1915-N3)-methyltransferase